MIYYDQSEAAIGTSLPMAVLQAGTKIVGLEALTGADIVITPNGAAPIPDNVLRPPQSLIAGDIVRHAILIQRKTASDLLNSIPHLDDTVQRMRSVVGPHIAVWLAPVGHFERLQDGKTSVWYNGTQKSTGWNYAAYRGALDAWQMRGGSIHMCEDDEEFVRFVLAWKDKKMIAALDPTVVVRQPGVEIGLTEHPQMAVLMGFPHIGSEVARNIMTYCDGNLAYALMLVSSVSDPLIGGIGKKMRDDWRKWMGLANDQELTIIERGEEWQRKK